MPSAPSSTEAYAQPSVRDLGTLAELTQSVSPAVAPLVPGQLVLAQLSVPTQGTTPPPPGGGQVPTTETGGPVTTTTPGPAPQGGTLPETTTGGGAPVQTPETPTTPESGTAGETETGAPEDTEVVPAFFQGNDTGGGGASQGGGESGELPFTGFAPGIAAGVGAALAGAGVALRRAVSGVRR
jgi:hypothetical protein